MDVSKYGMAIKETSYDKKLINSTILTLTLEEKEELTRWFRVDNLKLDYDIEECRKKIEQIRNRLYEYRKKK